MKSLGVDMAQGFFLGSPASEPVRSLNLRASDVLYTGKAPLPESASRPTVLAETRYSMLS